MINQCNALSTYIGQPNVPTATAPAPTTTVVAPVPTTTVVQPQPTAPAGHAPDHQPSKNEYQTGHVTCEACGEEISFRDEVTGGFTVRHWDLHRAQW